MQIPKRPAKTQLSKKHRHIITQSLTTKHMRYSVFTDILAVYSHCYMLNAIKDNESSVCMKFCNQWIVPLMIMQVLQISKLLALLLFTAAVHVSKSKHGTDIWPPSLVETMTIDMILGVEIHNLDLFLCFCCALPILCQLTF